MNNNTIKVVHIGTEISNSSAPLRIHKAVKSVGVDSKIITLKTSINSNEVYLLKRSLIYKVVNRIVSYQEKKILDRFQNKENLPFSFGRMGTSIVKNPFVQQADIIHLHWINGQFLSYREINRLMNLKKPVVWTFHDSWPMTGGCHVRYGCDRFKESCGCCPELHSSLPTDISNQIIKKKKKWYVGENLTIICPSKWMQKNASISSIFGKCRIVQVGNPLDTEIFQNKKNQIYDNKIRVLFGASGALELEYKGYSYLVDAINYLKQNRPDIIDKMIIQIFGTSQTKLEGLEDICTETLGFIKTEEEMASVYSQADVYVFPSLDDNLPGTVMESLACETPVVAFKTGGVPEMIKHRDNGYIAEYRNADDLAEGILWVLANNEGNVLGRRGRDSILMKYSLECSGKKYLEIYNSIISN